MKEIKHALDWVRTIEEIDESLRGYASDGYELVSVVTHPETQFILLFYKKEVQ